MAREQESSNAGSNYRLVFLGGAIESPIPLAFCPKSQDLLFEPRKFRGIPPIPFDSRFFFDSEINLSILKDTIQGQRLHFKISNFSFSIQFHDK